MDIGEIRDLEFNAPSHKNVHDIDCNNHGLYIHIVVVECSIGGWGEIMTQESTPFTPMLTFLRDEESKGALVVFAIVMVPGHMSELLLDGD